MTPHAQARAKVFISYSRRDREWVDRLRVHLKPLERDRGLTVWEDAELAVGSKWQEEIAQALATTKFAVFLVSADFIASDFIAAKELPQMLAVAEEGGAVIVPVIVSASRYLSTPLAAYTAANDPNRPLLELSKNEQEVVLKRVAEAIEASLDAAVGDTERQAPGLVPVLHQIRDPFVDFVGRMEEIDRIVSTLTKAPATGAAGAVIIVRGMGGVGKTELAYKVATRLESAFPDGQLLVELGGETLTPLATEQALRSIIRNFVSTETANRADTPAKLRGLFEATLAGRRVFILADNAKGAEQVRPLLPPAGCGLLVTTRQRFVLPGMLAVDLDSLPADAAELLLRQICPRIGDAAARLAQLCGRLPLALRVSASMLASDDALRVERYLERLADHKHRLALLHDPDDPSLDVGASLRLSYEALEPPAQDVLCQLSVFPTSFDLRAVIGVVQTSDAVDLEELLSLLRRRSLVGWSEEDQRYSLHDLVRVFASTQATDINAVRKRHAQYFAGLLMSAKRASDADTSESGAEGTGSTEPDVIPDIWDVAYNESTHIEAGWRWAKEYMGDSDADALLVTYAGALDDIFDVGVDAELVDASLAVLRRDGRQEETMSLLRDLGGLYVVMDSARAQRYYREGCEIARTLNDRPSEGGFLINVGMAHWQRDETERELECYEQAMAIGQETRSRWLEGSALENLGSVLGGISHRVLYMSDNVSFAISADRTSPVLDMQQAIERYEQALDIWRTDKHVRGEAMTSAHLGLLHDRLDDVPKAFEYYERALAVRANLNSGQERKVLRAMAVRFYEQQEYENAHQYAKQLLEACRREHHQRAECEALALLGDIAARLGDDGAAAEYQKQALALATEVGDASLSSAILNTLGEIAARAGAPDEALSYYEQAVSASRELDDREWRARLLCTLASAYDDAKRYDEGLAAYQEAIVLEPTPELLYDATLGLGLIHFGVRRYGEGRRAFLRAAEMQPSLYVPHALVGMTYREQQQYDQALVSFQRALELCTEDSSKASTLNWMGDALYEWGRYDEALASYRRAFEFEPVNGAALGRTYDVLGRVDDALSEYQRARAASPEDLDSALGLARVYRRTADQSNFETAMRAARDLIADDDNYGQARLAAIRGDVDEAIRRLEAALTAGEVSAPWVRRDPDFDFIRNDPRFETALDP